MRLSKGQIEFIRRHEGEDVGRLALLYGGKGRRGEYALEGEELRFALMQIEARQRLKEKLPTILEKREFVFPTRISTEQASSEVTARLKAELIRDLGLGTEDKGLRTGDNEMNWRDGDARLCVSTDVERTWNGDSGTEGDARLCVSTGDCGYISEGDDGFVSADLTGGLGVDTIFMARGSKRHHYVELNPEHSAAAEVNIPLFRDNVVVHNTDAESFMREIEERFDLVYADPARRSECNTKVFRLEDCVPNILELKPMILSKSRWLIVKLSPMLDVTQAIEKLGAEKVIVVSVNDECKELIAVCGHSGNEGCEIEAVEINKKGRWREIYEDENEDENENENEGLYGMPEVGMMMYEPYAAMMKVGHYEELAMRYGMKMVAPSSHLFFGHKDNGIQEFPGREFVVREVNTFTKNSIKGIKKANITVRNFPMSVAEVRKRFGIVDGGDVYIFLTTDNRGEKVVIRCEKIR